MYPKLKGNTIKLGIKTAILRKSNTCPPNPSSFRWSTLCLSPPSQRIIIFSSPFCTHHLHQTNMFHQEVGCLVLTDHQHTKCPFPSASNSDVPVMRWGILHSRLDNEPGLLCYEGSHIHSSTIRRASVTISVSISKKCSFSLYLIYITFFAHSFVLLV